MTGQRPSVRFFNLPEQMRPAVCKAKIACDGSDATVLAVEYVPGGNMLPICRACFEDFTGRHEPLPEGGETRKEDHP